MTTFPFGFEARSTLACVLALSAAALLSPPAHAGDAQKPPSSYAGFPFVPPTKSELDGRWDEGIRLAKKGDFEGAADCFEFVYGWTKEARVLLNLALAESSAGHRGQALRHLRKYLRDPQASPEKARGVVHDALPDLVAKTGRIVVDVEQSGLVVVDPLTDASALSFSVTPGEEVDLDPGEYEVFAIRAPAGTGYVRRTVKVAASAEAAHVGLSF